MGIISYPEFAHTLIKFSEHRPMETYTKSSFIVCRLWRCTLRLILSYVAPGAVRSIKIYRTSPLALYAPFNFIVRRAPRCTLYYFLVYV